MISRAQIEEKERLERLSRIERQTPPVSANETKSPITQPRQEAKVNRDQPQKRTSFTPVPSLNSTPVGPTSEKSKRIDPTPETTKTLGAKPPGESPSEMINRHALNQEFLAKPDVANRIRSEALTLQNVVVSSAISQSAGMGDSISTIGGQTYLQQFQESAGATEDSIERMLLEILAIGRLRFPRLFALGEEAKSPETLNIYLNAANRLMSAICGTVETLTLYRASREKRSGSKKNTSVQKKPYGELTSKEIRE